MKAKRKKILWVIEYRGIISDAKNDKWHSSQYIYQTRKHARWWIKRLKEESGLKYGRLWRMRKFVAVS